MCKEYLVVGYQGERVMAVESDGNDQAVPKIYPSCAAAHNSIAELHGDMKEAGMEPCDLDWRAVVYEGPEQMEQIAKEAGLR